MDDALISLVEHAWLMYMSYRYDDELLLLMVRLLVDMVLTVHRMLVQSQPPPNGSLLILCDDAP